MKNHKIILDTDPGIDDAVAIVSALSSENIDIKLITTVSGNVSVDKTTNNVLKLLTFMKKNIKVSKGADHPLIRRPIFADDIHGESGMDGYEFLKMNLENLSKTSAVDSMIKVLEKEDDISIVALGPLTNIASLLLKKPKIKEKIKNIILMGGAIGRGNCGIYSEFNFAVDPEAARIVFESGIFITVFPIEVGKKAKIPGDISFDIKTYNQTGNMFYHLFRNFRSGDFNHGLNMYDPLTIAFLEDESLFEIKDVRIDIETQGELTSGASLCDFDSKENNAKIAIDIDQIRFIEWFKSVIKRCDDYGNV